MTGFDRWQLIAISMSRWYPNLVNHWIQDNKCKLNIKSEERLG